ncbi:MAG: radical SAM protein [Spirochaetes bacterium]|nr:radical SAM protein [Spirochaetota bacterium]
MKRQKLLLTGVFGPYGIKNKYAEGLGMQMELLNNQITRCQGVHSPRQSYWTFPLYLLAENISVETTVLDFPSWKDFARELERGYTHVGINFIVPNVLKAKKMAEYIRERHPSVKIILGGYGATIPELDKIMPFDAACIGEGVRWLREYFGEDADAPVRHPIILGPAYEMIYGYRSRPAGGILMPGVGCENGCKFCVTSHVFKKSYRSLLPSGRDIFDVCVKSESKLGARGFSIMDENFLKHPERARELLELMTDHGKPYVFDIFSSAEVIKKMGVDFLVRLGVRLVWVGVESRKSAFEKTRGIDLRELFAELRSKGIMVNASAILFQDHHDRKTLNEDIEYVIGLGSDLVQFMNYTPLPLTTLHEELTSQGRMKNIPYKKITGAGELAFTHPHINDRREHVSFLRDAFRKKYIADGPGILSMAQTAVTGYERAVKDFIFRKENRLSWNPDTIRYEKSMRPVDDEFMGLRIKMMRRIAKNLRPVLLAARVYAPNARARKKAAEISKKFISVLGKPDIGTRIASAVLVATAAVEFLKTALSRIMGRESVIYQPRSRRVEYARAISFAIARQDMKKILDLVPEFIIGAMKRRRVSLRMLAKRAKISPDILKGIISGRAMDITEQTVMAVMTALGYRILTE